MRVRRGWRQSGETQSCLALGLKTGYKGQGEYQEAPFLVFCRSLAGVGPFSRIATQVPGDLMSSSVILRYQACMWHRNIKKYIWQWREFGSEATCRCRRSLRVCTPCCSAELPPSPSPSQWAPCSSSVPWIRAQTRSMSTSTRGNFNPHPLEAHAGRSLILQASLVYVVSSRPVRNTVP